MKFQHQAISDVATTTYPARLEITFTDMDFQINEYVIVKETTLPGSDVSVETFD
jgi:hypothetical protein